MTVATDFASSSERVYRGRWRRHISSSSPYQDKVSFRTDLSKPSLIQTQEESLVATSTSQASGQCLMGSFFQSSKKMLPGSYISSCRVPQCGTATSLPST